MLAWPFPQPSIHIETDSTYTEASVEACIVTIISRLKTIKRNVSGIASLLELPGSLRDSLVLQTTHIGGYQS